VPGLGSERSVEKKEAETAVLERSVENIFCLKCHKLAAQKRVTPERVELLKNGRVLLSLSTKPSQDGHHPWWKFWQKTAPKPQSRGNRIGVRCPDGHNVQVNL